MAWGFQKSYYALSEVKGLRICDLSKFETFGFNATSYWVSSIFAPAIWHISFDFQLWQVTTLQPLNPNYTGYDNPACIIPTSEKCHNLVLDCQIFKLFFSWFFITLKYTIFKTLQTLTIIKESRAKWVLLEFELKKPSLSRVKLW